MSSTATTYTAHVGPDSLIRSAERGFAARFRLTSTDICGRSLTSLLHRESAFRVRRQLQAMLDGTADQFTERVLGRAGPDAVFSGELSGIAVQDVAGLLAGTVIHLRPDHEKPAVLDPATVSFGPIDARVLEGIAGGASTVQLATRLFLSRQGVDYHIRGMLRRLDVTKRSALVARAYSLGVLALASWPPKILPHFLE